MSKYFHRKQERKVQSKLSHSLNNFLYLDSYSKYQQLLTFSYTASA